MTAEWQVLIDDTDTEAEIIERVRAACEQLRTRRLWEGQSIGARHARLIPTLLDEIEKRGGIESKGVRIRGQLDESYFAEFSWPKLIRAVWSIDRDNDKFVRISIVDRCDMTLIGALLDW